VNYDDLINHSARSDATMWVFQTFLVDAPESTKAEFRAALGEDTSGKWDDHPDLASFPWLADPDWRTWGTWEDVRKMPRRWRDLFVQGLLLHLENPSEVPEDLLPSISEVSLANPKGKRSALHALATAQGLSLTRVARASSVGVARVADFFAGKTLPTAVAEKIEKGLESLGVVEKL
jgi:hypothetical protein